MRLIRQYFLFIISVTILSTIVSCSEGNYKPDELLEISITLNQDNLNMSVGEIVKLKVVITPEQFSDQMVLWGSTNNTVATVSDDGFVTAISEGTTVITVKAGGKSASCNVYVSSPKDDEIMAIQSGYIVTTAGLDATVKIISSGPWTLSGSDEYIYPSIKSGGDGASVVFKATDKPVMTGQNLNADFVFKCGDASTTITLSRFSDMFTVFNVASTASCNIGENINHPVVGATNSFDVRITHSLDYEVCFSDSWIHNNHVSTTTLSTTVYSETFQSVETIIIDANEDSPDATPDRIGQVYFKYKGNTVATIHINQVGQPKAGNILFADDRVKDYCVLNYDSNGDGEVSYREAANVYSSFANKNHTNANFFENAAEDITSFDELEHFYHITLLGHGALAECTQLKSIKLPPYLETLQFSVFLGCISLERIVLPSTLKQIGAGAFADCSKLEDINIPNSVTQIGYTAFSGCSSLKEITIPNSVDIMDRAVFANCTGLKKVTLPSTITLIDSGAFGGCVALSSVYLAAMNPPQLGDNAFTLNTNGDINAQLKIYVPQESLDKYKDDPKWSLYRTHLVGYQY